MTVDNQSSVAVTLWLCKDVCFQIMPFGKETHDWSSGTCDDPKAIYTASLPTGPKAGTLADGATLTCDDSSCKGGSSDASYLTWTGCHRGL